VLASPLLLVLTAWMVIGLALIGIGLLFHRLGRAPVTTVESLLQSFWLGWALLLLLLQLWHFFLPVGRRAAVVTAVLGLFGIVVGGWRPWAALLRGLPRHLLALAFFMLLALGLADRALDGPHFGDVGLYHLPVVYWDEAYPIVPGLGNLYVPFGHNISYFLYVALLDVGPFAHRSFHLVNTILVLALFARGLLGIDRVARVRHPCAPHDAYWALVLPIAVAQAFSIFLTSPSPDQPIFVLGLVLAGELVAFVGRSGPRRAPDFDVLAITLLATAAVTVKLSIAGLAGAVWLLVMVRWLWHDRPLRQDGGSTLATVIQLGAIGATIWVTGNIVLTGCPLYPSDFAALPVDWRVRVDAVKWIEAPMVWGGPLWKVIWNWPWVVRRLDSLGWVDRSYLVPMAITLLATPAACVHRVIRRSTGVRRLPFVILVPALLSFAFCFATTPMPRYFGATLWILAVDSLLLLMGSAVFGAGRVSRVVATLGVVVATGSVLFVQRPPLLLPAGKFEIMPAPEVEVEHLPSGLGVRVPRVTQTCWDAPLPCTPDPNPALRVRRAGDLGSGFAIDTSAPPSERRP